MRASAVVALEGKRQVRCGRKRVAAADLGSGTGLGVDMRH